MLAVLLVAPLLVGAAIETPSLAALREGLQIAWLFADPRASS